MKKIFIANRGEIAVRIIRACRELGITSVIGYSDADRASLAVRMADEAYRIGPPASAESYLNIPVLIETIKRTNCDAVHPGYGFLSERPAFAAACEENGITFIGPKSKIIDLMGDKTRARRAVSKANMPVVPGTMEPIQDAAEAKKIATEFGFPVMIKAAAGGGGKGLRVVNSATELESAIQIAQSEAQSAFGDSSIYIEKKIESPHHVEIQVIADHHGNVVYLGERECSIQRRHQKVIEETPSPFISDDVRKQMCEVAVRAAQEIGYTNAGTMEFLVDANQNFYFLEMNTRLQVEHPITEMVTGIDLVREQIGIASGEPLSFKQSDVKPRGAAIECRIYAEDPYLGFLPSPGKITRLRTPSGPSIRDDSGIYEGYEVSIYYDPLLSKLVTWGKDRTEAIQRMSRALREYQVLGIQTTVEFYQGIMEDKVFLSGNYSTAFLQEFFSRTDNHSSKADPTIAMIAAAIYELEHSSSASATTRSTNISRWKMLGRKESLGE